MSLSRIIIITGWKEREKVKCIVIMSMRIEDASIVANSCTIILSRESYSQKSM